MIAVTINVMIKVTTQPIAKSVPQSESKILNNIRTYVTYGQHGTVYYIHAYLAICFYVVLCSLKEKSTNRSVRTSVPIVN